MKVNVPCVVCGKVMLLFPSVVKQKRTCSKECAKNRVPQVEYTCSVCGKVLLLPPSLASIRKTCSRTCDAVARSRQMTKYTALECGCEFCGKVFLSKRKGRFCSQECFHKYWNDKSKQEKICPICSCTFSVWAKNKDKTYCSHKCQYKAQSLGLIKSYSRGNYGYRQDLKKTFRSSLEANFARVCVYNGWKWEFENKCFETEMGVYTPDFWIEEWHSFVELRGFKGRSLQKPELAAKQYGFNLIVIYEDEFRKKYGHLQGIIREWEDSRRPIEGMIDPSIYEKRLCKCGKRFLYRLSKTNVGRFCSGVCANKYKWEKSHQWHRRKNVKVVCPVCRADFHTTSGKKFCSKKCYWESMRVKYV